MSGNRILEDTHSAYRSIMPESQRLPAARHERIWEAAVEHERIVEAIAMHDPDGASYFMRVHTTRAADRAGLNLVEVAQSPSALRRRPGVTSGRLRQRSPAAVRPLYSIST